MTKMGIAGRVGVSFGKKEQHDQWHENLSLHDVYKKLELNPIL